MHGQGLGILGILGILLLDLPFSGFPVPPCDAPAVRASGLPLPLALLRQTEYILTMLPSGGMLDLSRVHRMPQVPVVHPTGTWGGARHTQTYCIGASSGRCAARNKAR